MTITFNPALATNQAIADAAVAYFGKVSQRCEEAGSCLYFRPSDGHRCVIGSMLVIPPEEEDAIYFSPTWRVGVAELPEGITFPESISIEMLEDFQQIHDTHDYWGEHGLNEEGWRRLNYSIENCELDWHGPDL